MIIVEVPYLRERFPRIALRPAKPSSPLRLRRVKSRNSNRMCFARWGSALEFRVYAVSLGWRVETG